MNVIELIVCIFHFENRRPVFEDLNASPNRLTFDTHVEFWLKTVNTKLKAKKDILSCEDWGSTLHWIFHRFCSLVRLDFLKFCWWKHKTNARLKSFRRWFFLHTNFLIFLINIQRYWLLVFPCVGFFMPSQREGERDQLTNLNVNFTTNALELELMLLNSNSGYLFICRWVSSPASI